jgi:hypothetical protein
MANIIAKSVHHNGTVYDHTSLIAKEIGITTFSVNKWLRDHPEFLGNPEYMQIRPNGSHKIYYMSKRGFQAYLISKDTGRGENNSTRDMRFSVAKQEFTDKAMEQNAQIQELSKDPVIAMRLQQMEMERRISALEEKGNMYRGLPAPTEEVPEFTPRMALRELINRYVSSNGGSHGEAWTFLYDRFASQFHIDLRARSRNTGKDKLAMAEELGVINKLYALAVRLFVI